MDQFFDKVFDLMEFVEKKNREPNGENIFLILGF